MGRRIKSEAFATQTYRQTDKDSMSSTELFVRLLQYIPRVKGEEK